MGNAVKCPICMGDGEVLPPNSQQIAPCHGCDGKGWVQMNDNEFYPPNQVLQRGHCPGYP